MNTKIIATLFNLRPIEASLYEKLFYGGRMGATELAKQAGISRTSAYDLLENLASAGLITESQKNGIKIFSVEEPKKLQLLFKERENVLEEAKKALSEMEKEFENKKQSAKPRLQMYEGRAELQQMMKDLLLYRDITVQAYWPVKKMVELLTPEFMDTFHKERAARNISLRVIWPAAQAPHAKNYSFLGSKAELKREARVAPHNVDFSLGYTIYQNKVRFISSSKENFGFLIESSELSEMMRDQFEVLWKESKKLNLG